VVLLEREAPAPELFETLESEHNDGLVQRCGKAQERRSLVRETKAQGEIPRRGEKAERGSADGAR
jgi:hypothetical protein